MSAGGDTKWSEPPPRDMSVDQELREVMRVHCHPNDLDESVRKVERYFAEKYTNLLNYAYIKLCSVSDYQEALIRDLVIAMPLCPGCKKKKPKDWDERLCPECGDRKEDEIAEKS